MKNREFKKYLQDSLQEDRAARPEKKEETLARCRKIMGKQGKTEIEVRNGFWQFLSDVFRFEGFSIIGLQAGILFLVCIQLEIMGNVSYYIPAFTPLFALSVMPALLRSQFYKMEEMEAVTRTSGMEILIAKLILAGAANLVGITVVLGLAIYLRQSGEGIGEMMLYSLVPYLVCMTAILRLIRLRRREKLPVCAAVTIGCCMVWGMSAKALPQIYESSAIGVWLLLFIVFAGFFGREIGFMIERKREGKGYGSIG